MTFINGIEKKTQNDDCGDNWLKPRTVNYVLSISYQYSQQTNKWYLLFSLFAANVPYVPYMLGMKQMKHT